MNATDTRHYYLFTGNLYNRLLELIDMLEATGHKNFEIWEPHDKTRGLKLLVVDGEPLSASFCVENRIWETGQNVFAAFYSQHTDEYDIHPRYYYCTN